METGKGPRHVGIILDGNRRFSKRLMMEPWKGHEFGSEKVKKLFTWCKEIDIRELTLYTLSVENFSRPKKEFEYLMDLFRKGFDEMKDDSRIHDDKIRIVFIGRISMLPEDMQEKMRIIMDMTKDYDNYRINFAMAYGGRAEVIDAVKKVAEQVKSGKIDIEDINDEVFGKNLYMEDEPDLIIRTGGAKRTSNFLIWQSSYSEWIFLDKFWPEFEKEDLFKAVEDFRKRERRFGK